MKVTDTISVNPSKTALGHVETSSDSIFRSRVIGMEPEASSMNLSKVLFPSYVKGVSEFGKYEVPLRTLFATILIVFGLALIGATQNIALAVCSLSFGAFLAIGFLTRPILIGAAAYYAIMGALSIRTGQPDITLFALMFGCMVFGIVGSGKYSCDTLIRKTILHNKKSMKIKKEENFMEYKAFHKVKY